MPNLLKLDKGIAFLDDWPEEGKCFEDTCGLTAPHSHETWKYEQPKLPSVPFLPATLSFIAALLGFCGFQVYAVLAGGWRWSVVGVIALVAFSCVGGALQSYANRRAR